MGFQENNSSKFAMDVTFFFFGIVKAYLQISVTRGPFGELSSVLEGHIKTTYRNRLVG
jgi:hypothetical protein